MLNSTKWLLILILLQYNNVLATMNINSALSVFDDIQNNMQKTVYKSGYQLSTLANDDVINAAVNEFNSQVDMGWYINFSVITNRAPRVRLNADCVTQLYKESIALYNNSALKNELQKILNKEFSFRDTFKSIVTMHNFILKNEGIFPNSCLAAAIDIKNRLTDYPINTFLECCICAVYKNHG